MQQKNKIALDENADYHFVNLDYVDGIRVGAASYKKGRLNEGLAYNMRKLLEVLTNDNHRNMETSESI